MSLKLVKAEVEKTLNNIFGPGTDSIELGAFDVKTWKLRQSSFWFTNPVMDVRLIRSARSMLVVSVYLNDNVYPTLELVFNSKSTPIEVQSTIRFEIQKLISARTAFGSVMKYFFNI